MIKLFIIMILSWLTLSVIAAVASSKIHKYYGWRPVTSKFWEYIKTHKPFLIIVYDKELSKHFVYYGRLGKEGESIELTYDKDSLILDEILLNDPDRVEDICGWRPIIFNKLKRSNL